MDDKNPDKQSKRVRLYYIAAILLILVSNTIISPMFFQPKVSYTIFLSIVDEGMATKVEITKDRIALLCNQEGKEQIYVTGRVDDPELVSRLVKAKVEFSQVIPKQESPIMSFFNNWILPFLLFMVIGQLIMRYLGPKIAGGQMKGNDKGNAKVNIATQKGTAVKDVAGQRAFAGAAEQSGRQGKAGMGEQQDGGGDESRGIGQVFPMVQQVYCVHSQRGLNPRRE